jgi:hypothetical protein
MTKTVRVNGKTVRIADGAGTVKSSTKDVLLTTKANSETLTVKDPSAVLNVADETVKLQVPDVIKSQTGLSQETTVKVELGGGLSDYIPGDRAKYFEELVTTLEFLGFNRSQNLPDSTVLGDVHLVALSKVLEDLVSSSEELQLLFGRVLEHGSSASDTLTLLIAKAWADFPIVNDTKVITIDKGLTENPAVLEFVDRLIEKQINSPVLTTDDFGGEATADDDQTIQFIKGVTEICQSSEELTLLAEFSRAFPDTLVLNELTSKYLDKLMLDDAQLGESQSKDFLKLLFEVSSLADALFVTMDKLVTDIVSVTEVISNDISKSIEDVVYVTAEFPTLLTAVYENYASGLMLSDLTSLHASKQHSELVTATETIEGFRESYFAENYAFSRYVGNVYNF